MILVHCSVFMSMCTFSSYFFCMVLDFFLPYFFFPALVLSLVQLMGAKTPTGWCPWGLGKGPSLHAGRPQHTAMVGATGVVRSGMGCLLICSILLPLLSPILVSGTQPRLKLLPWAALNDEWRNKMNAVNTPAWKCSCNFHPASSPEKTGVKISSGPVIWDCCLLPQVLCSSIPCCVCIFGWALDWTQGNSAACRCCLDATLLLGANFGHLQSTGDKVGSFLILGIRRASTCFGVLHCPKCFVAVFPLWRSFLWGTSCPEIVMCSMLHGKHI